MKPEWKFSESLVDYVQATADMERRIAAIYEKKASELLWALEHPPLYTGGTSAKAKDLLNPKFPVYETGRGGEYTYHGPGQRVVYVMLDLASRNRQDLKRYVYTLEEWIIRALKEFGVDGERRQGRVGIWVKTPEGEKKIAAIGIRVRKWVAYHGLAINVNPDLSHFEGIVPCGIRDYGVTSLHAIGVSATMRELDKALMKHQQVILG